MIFEQQQLEKNETQTEIPLASAKRLMDKLPVSNKNTVTKWLIGAMAGTVAITAVETQNIDADLEQFNTQNNLTAIEQKVISKVKKRMTFEVAPDISSVSAVLGIPEQYINNHITYRFCTESVNDNESMNAFYNKEIPSVGDNIYFVSKNALAVTEKSDNGDDNLFTGFMTTANVFSLQMKSILCQKVML